MAGDGMSIDSSSNRVLWQFISGSGVLRPQELIEHEVKKNKKRLTNGLLFYKPHSGKAEEQLKKERKVSGRQLQFILNVAKFLDLDEVQCHDLFCAFLVNDFRGSKKSLKQVLSQERQSQSLMLKMRDFYLTERLYLLRCLHHVLVFSHLEHPYQNVYRNFLREIQDNGESIQDKMMKQLQAVCETEPPSQETHGRVMTNHQVLTWVTHNLKEQSQLLETVLMFHKQGRMKVNTLLAYLGLFKKQGFGLYQTYRHLLDESTEKYVNRIRYLQVMTILQALDVGEAISCSAQDNFVDFHLAKGSSSAKGDNFQAVHSRMCSLGTDAVHGPVLLAWCVVRQLVCGPDASDKERAETHRLGQVALQLDVFNVLLQMLSCEALTAESGVGAVCHFAVYELLHAVLSIFHEDTLGSSHVLYDLCNQLLRQPAVAQDVWDKDDGLWLLYESAMSYFPLHFSRFLSMTVALASASRDSADMVRSTLMELSVYTEYLDNNSARHLTPSPLHPRTFTLTADKLPYPVGDFVLPRGTSGQVIELSELPHHISRMLSGPVIRWEASYNGWSLFLAEVSELLRQITQGAGMVQEEQVERVTMVMELVHHVLKSQTAAVTQEFAPFLDLCYDLVHRFSVLRPAPLDLLSAAVNCIVCAVQHFPGPVWHKMMQTGLLPYLTENVDNLAEVLSGAGLNPGALGAIQAGTECTHARYPLTLAVLDLISSLIQSFSREKRQEDLLACLLHIVKEVFPLFRKWRYAHLSQRKMIGQQCLTLFHKILNLSSLPASDDSQPALTHRPSIQEVCVYSLLFTEAGRALMEIVATGVDNVEMALVQQGSLAEGGGIDLMDLIQLSLSVLNRLLLLRPPHLPPSPVEQALSWQPAGRQSQHVVATMAQYIYHRHNPKLPTLATLLLKRLAMMSPLSILACLGNEAEPIRDMYLSRLQALSEDLRLKVAILELLSVCVETQPGLIEIFFDVQMGSGQTTEGKKAVELGVSSCLQTVLTLLDVHKQTTYHCPPDLLRAGLDLVHSLWRGRRETAMEALRSKQSFWASVTAPLKRDVLPANTETQSEVEVNPTDIKIVAFSFRILAQELYMIEGSRVDGQLKACLEELGKLDRFTYWSQCVRSSLQMEAMNDEETDDDISDNPTMLLLKSWRNFLMVLSRSKLSEELQMTSSKKEQIMSHLLEGLQAQFSGHLSVLSMKLSAVVSTLYYTLLSAWGSVGKATAVLVGVRGTLEETCSSSDRLIPDVQLPLVASLSLLIQRARGDPAAALTSAAISTVVGVSTAMLLQSTRQLPAPAALSHTPMDVSSAHASPDSSLRPKLMLQVTLCSLLTEVVTSTESSSWLPHLQQHGVLTALLISMETYIKAKQGLSYVHSALLLLTAIAQTHKGATVLAASDLTAHTCLSVSNLYTDHLSVSKVISGVTTWHAVFCLTLDLYTLMLRHLAFSFLDDALNFLGAHQDRLLQSLELARVTLLESAMLEGESICNFLHQMSLYRRQWRLHLPLARSALLSCMLKLVQTYVSLLIRPRYLQHILERGGESGDKGKRSLQSSPLLQHQTSTEDVDQPTSQLIATENSMLRIVGKCVAVLRQFSPDLCQVLLDQSMDLCEYEPLIDLGFSTPSVDNESTLTFGSLISCVTACLRRLYKEHKSPSPHRVHSPHRKSPRPPVTREPQTPKVLLHYVMENCLTLAMSQACRYLREPSLPQRDKHFLKRELSTELNSFLSSMLRHFRRGGLPGSPGDKSLLISPQAGGGGGGVSSSATGLSSTTTMSGGQSLTRSLSQTAFTSGQEQKFFKLLQEFVQKVLR